MPTYDYSCPANGRIVEVMHRMSDTLNTWGELCEKAGIELGNTPPESPVARLATGGNVISSSSRGSGVAPPCVGGGCPGGVCGLD